LTQQVIGVRVPLDGASDYRERPHFTQGSLFGHPPGHDPELVPGSNLERCADRDRRQSDMRVALTGATGFIGSHILAELHAHGHGVTALVRDDAQSDAVTAQGATPVVVDLYNRPAVVEAFGAADGAIHTASPGDATSADLDAAVVDAAIEAFDGTGKPYLHISGVWIYGGNTAITEDSPFDAPAMVSWKEPIERRVLDTSGMRGVVIPSSVAYGDGGGGMPGLLLGSPRDSAGNLVMLGTGQQHWSTVHVEDLADLFRRVLENDSAQGYYVVGNGLNPTVAELTEAAAVAIGAPGAVPGSDEEARARLGDYFAEVLLLDQGTAATRASELGWLPTRPGLVDEFRDGSYRH
jgi:nucleoside-diphosphate-sugar epimerase